MTQTLSLNLRPATLESFIGNPNVTASIHKQLSERVPVAILISGIPGAGKTTLARIISRIVNPGVDNPDVENINGGADNGVDKVRALIEGAAYCPFSGQKKVVIIDEAHALTGAAQQALLIPCELDDSSTLWIFTSSNPDKLDKALKSRCVHYALKPMGEVETRALVQRAAENTGSEYDTTTFIAHMVTSQITSPRDILMCWERYASGTPLKDCRTGEMQEPIYADIAKAVLKGDWNRTRGYLEQLKIADFRGLRAVLSHFLKTALLNEQIGVRADTLSEALMGMLQYGGGSYEDGIAYSGLVGIMYRCCKKLKG